MHQVYFPLKLKFSILPLIADHVTEYCAVIGTHSTVGQKLLYSHVLDPLPWCRMGSGHVSLTGRQVGGFSAAIIESVDSNVGIARTRNIC